MDRETNGRRVAAVVLAAGKGKRMGTSIQKQYLELDGKPLIYYALKAFEDSPVEEIILVTGKEEVEYCRKEIVERYGLKKVSKIVEGGAERYHSVFEGLKALEYCDYVLIHDGARPCVTKTVIEAAIEGAVDYDACVIGMPVKDTVKIADEAEYAAATPDRSRLWQIQTPQAFQFSLVYEAYQKLFTFAEYQKGVTDDAMVIESMTDRRVKLIRGDYSNIKVTTPEDMAIARVLLKRNEKKAGSQ